MLTDLFLSFAVIAGIAALWRTYRYDAENPMNAYLDTLPYFIRKPITCGLCFTYWTALVYAALFTPLNGWLPEMRFILGVPFFTFISSWMILGTGAAIILYALDTFFQVSHYYKHRAHPSGSHEDAEHSAK